MTLESHFLFCFVYMLVGVKQVNTTLLNYISLYICTCRLFFSYTKLNQLTSYIIYVLSLVQSNPVTTKLPVFSIEFPTNLKSRVGEGKRKGGLLYYCSWNFWSYSILLFYWKQKKKFSFFSLFSISRLVK